MQIMTSGVEHVITECQAIVQNVPGQEVKLLKFVSRGGEVFTFPMTNEAAKTIGHQLTSGLVVASGPLPPLPNGDPRQ